MNKIEYLLSTLAEEANEIGLASSKCNRFGLEHNPFTIENKLLSNIEHLIFEVNDVYAILEMLQEDGVITGEIINRDMIIAKKIKLTKMMKISQDLGTLSLDVLL